MINTLYRSAPGRNQATPDAAFASQAQRKRQFSTSPPGAEETRHPHASPSQRYNTLDFVNKVVCQLIQ